MLDALPTALIGPAMADLRLGTGMTSQAGDGCSKLTTSLDNVSLKLKTSILQIHCYFCWKNVRTLRFSHFSNKNNSVFDNVVGIYLTR